MGLAVTCRPGARYAAIRCLELRVDAAANVEADLKEEALMARVFITGSTEGRAAARSLLDAGHEVVLHARSPERASTLADLSPRSTAIAVGDLRSAAEVCSIESR
jgi:shikimate 5-dehydrogenase